MIRKSISGSFNIAAAGNLYSSALLMVNARRWTMEINFTTGGVSASPTWRIWPSMDGSNWPSTNTGGPYSPGTGARRVIQSNGPDGTSVITGTTVENLGMAPFIRLEIGNPSALAIVGTYKLIAWD